MRMTGLRTMIQVRVDTNADKIAKLVAQLPDSQLNFALALAINRTLKTITEHTKAELSQKFKIRSKWTAKGIRSTPTNKKKLEGVVGSIDKYMQRQEDGEKKKSKGGRGSHLAIPTVYARRGKHALGRIVKPPKTLLAPKNKAFKQTVNGVYGIWRRRSKRRYPIDLFYTLTNNVAVAPRWNFGKTGEEISKHVFDKHFIDALEFTLATAH